MPAPQNLIVAFHGVADDLIPPGRLSGNFASVTTSTAERLALSRSGKPYRLFYLHISADNATEAVTLLKRNSLGAPMVIVTECPALAQAAQKAEIKTLPPAEIHTLALA